MQSGTRECAFYMSNIFKLLPRLRVRADMCPHKYLTSIGLLIAVLVSLVSWGKEWEVYDH